MGNGLDEIFNMPRLTSLRYLASLKDGRLTLPRARMEAELKLCDDEPDVEVIIRREKRPKTWEQLKAFHGPIIEQVQADTMAREGVYKCAERIKDELKEQFLPKAKQYYDDGSPVMIHVQHPERRGVAYAWHLEKVPSLESLSVEQMRSFIDAILEFYLHEMGLNIVIDPALSKIK